MTYCRIIHRGILTPIFLIIVNAYSNSEFEFDFNARTLKNINKHLANSLYSIEND